MSDPIDTDAVTRAADQRLLGLLQQVVSPSVSTNWNSQSALSLADLRAAIDKARDSLPTIALHPHEPIAFDYNFPARVLRSELVEPGQLLFFNVPV